jgi:hypothetical protein
MVLDDKQKGFVKNKLLEEVVELLSVYKGF